MRRWSAMRLSIACGLSLASASSAMAQQGQVNVAMQFSGLASCDVHPSIPFRIDNIPFRVTGTATLRENRNASMDLAIAGLLAPTRLRLNARLGGAPTSVPGGTAELRVVSDSELRMIWHLRTSSLIVDMRLTGQSCSLSVDTQLKPGATRYSLYDGRSTHMCGKPAYTALSCSPR